MNTIKLWIYKLLTSWLPESRGFGLKCALLRWAGAKIGANVRIYSSVRILGNGALNIGDDVHIGPDVMIVSASPAVVNIGDCIDIGPRVLLETGSHQIDVNGSRVAGSGTAKDIRIGNGSWLGANVTVLSGVSLAEKTIAAAGAVITKSVQTPCTLVAGIPASIKKQLKG